MALVLERTDRQQTQAYTHTHAHTYTQTHTDTHAHMDTHRHTYTPTHIHTHLSDDLRVTETVEVVVLDLEELSYPAADVPREAVAGGVLDAGIDHADRAREVEGVVGGLVADDHAVPRRREPVPGGQAGGRFDGSRFVQSCADEW